MEEKLPNDKLEDFLKKSFEDYTDSPSGDLWGRIEENLPPPAAGWLTVSRKWWLAAAALVIMLGIFTCQHFYFTNQITQLNKKLEQKSTEQQKPASQQQQKLPAETTLPDVMQSTEPKGTNPPGSAPVAHQVTTGNIKTVSPAISRRNRTAAGTSGSKTFASAENTENKSVPDAGPQDIYTSGIQMKTAETGFNNPVPPAASPERQTLTESLPMQSIRLLPVHVSTPNTNFLYVSASPDPSQRLSLGVRAATFAVQETISKVQPDRFPNRPGKPQKFVNNQKQVNGQALALGAVLEYKLGSHFSFAGGLDFLQSKSASTHQAVFLFKERKMPPGGQHPNRHDFQYNLNTSSGLVEVDVRVESSDPSTVIPDQEELMFEIETRKSVNYLSLPLALKYAVGNGRLQAYFKGGIAVNFLLHDEFVIEKIRLDNSHFNISPAAPGKRKQQYLKPATLNYVVSAGLEYRMSEKISLNLEPAVMGSLGNQQTTNFIQSSSQLAGVSAGMRYTF